jgi:hypothetical protein
LTSLAGDVNALVKAKGGSRRIAIRLRASLSLLLVVRLCMGLCAAMLSALGLTTFNWDVALDISLAILAGIIWTETLGSFLWARTYFGATLDPDIPRSNVHADAAKVSITTQGVVLGLVSLSSSSKLTVTLKVGAAALGAGVVVATILYLLVAGMPPPDQKRAVVAGLLLSLTFWLLTFGLVCVVAGNWSR